MSWGIAILVVVMIAIAALVGRAMADKRKRFGLKEAKAAARYAGEDADAARFL